ncbi:msx2-interacting protein isoform X3 [Hippopotamus amphibius kiboko]|uniref:msx2-interacting protein isoform X3 n=1 Tax=Hippopotamus amphibius kiboko TaxID=575201 RepID=UPI002599D2F2|nr:msx2-interacting protein isoform X3 [Hippopotamus amphibius kiboko]
MPAQASSWYQSGPRASSGPGAPLWPQRDTPAFPRCPARQHLPLPLSPNDGAFVPRLPLLSQTAPSSGGSCLRGYKLERTVHGTPAEPCPPRTPCRMGTGRERPFPRTSALAALAPGHQREHRGGQRAPQMRENKETRAKAPDQSFGSHVESPRTEPTPRQRSEEPPVAHRARAAPERGCRLSLHHANIQYGRVESVKILPKRGSEGGVAAFVDFVDIKSAQKAHNSVNKMGDRDLRTDYNEPGTIPSAARGLDDTVSLASRSREVSGFRGGGGGSAYGPPPSLHAREGRYERRLDGASDNRERAYEHSAYGHHERGTGGFDRTRHYDQDYYRDPRERTLQHGLYYTSRSRSPNRFDAHDPRYEPRAREQFTLPSVVHRDIYRDDITREVRGRRPERNYQHSRSRSPHSSQSRNQSPQRLASQASRPTRSPSGSGSRSRSSSSDSISSSSSTSSDSTDSSSSSSDDSPARSVQSAAVPAPASQLLSSLEKDEPRKSFGIKVQNLPVRSTDTSLKDGLFHEFKKFGKVTSVQIHGTSEERYGLVFFRQQEDQEKALTASKGKLFFGMQIEVTAWIGPETESENEFRPLDERIDEFHPKATRTLFIGNLEKTTTYHDLRNIFQRFGEIVDIDIKKVNGVPQYAFLQYCDIASVCKAIKKMDGEYLGNNRLKLGFGKSMPTNCVWLDGLSSNVSDQYLTRHFCRYGPVVKVDFANRESQLAFYHCMEKSGQDIRDFYEMLAERREERRGSYDYSQDRTYYENVRTPGTYPEDSRRDYPARGREFYSEWETYQGDYYESRYYDDPREYRDYRNDPYEQDIREYSYRQRERERERERFESDRDRDHERRPIERSQSPVHLRRPQSPGTSPSQSERLPSDSERRIYSRSSDRSGSCSSLSPPRYDKLDKPRLERYTKNEKTDKERTFDPERLERERRLIRKEKVEKDKTDKQKRKGKVHSPSSQSSETDQENEREQSPEKSRSSNKLSREKADKEGVAKNRLELMPCVVLTRVKEKEGKVIDHTPLEKLKAKLDNDTVKSSALDQKLQVSQTEPAKSELSKLDSVRMKVPKERGLSSHIEVVDKEGRPKPRKHLKPEQSADGVSAVDLEKLEARKRRFADSSLKAERQKSDGKKSSPEMEDARVLLKKQPDISSRDVILLREGESEKKPVRKEVLKREAKKIKLDRLNAVPSPKDCQELASISVGTGSRPSSDLHARLREPVGESVENQEIQSKKPTPSKPQLKQLELLDDQGPEREDNRKNYCSLRDEPLECKSGQDKPHSVNTEEKIGIDIDHTQSYRKQMEQSRRKQQMEMEIAKSEKFGSPKKDVDEYERRSLVHEVGKPPQDVTDDSPPSKKKRMDHVDFDICTKRERNYRSSRQISEDSERTGGSPSVRHGSFHEEDDPIGSPRVMSIKGSPKVDEKGLPYSNIAVREESLKFNPYDSSRREQMADMAKIKLSVLNPEDELNRWDSQMKQDASRFDVSFPNSIIKRDSLRKRSVRDLEPGEVPSDSDEDGEHKSHSPRASALFESSRLSFLLRDREDKLRERDERLSSSLERNKFYSFALDKTITPDTKALLERAKSLSSSREENWSFLDWDSRFANFRNNKDKEKVDSTPRPIPSWYMKKKKIRTDSEGKMDDKKDDHKEEEQERQELFASRFLHSSIFEQDSRRLQHLERKDEDSDLASGRLYGRQTSDGANSTADLIQEPVVLFHSRFMELTRMQQKEKEKDQKPKEVEKQEDTEDHPKTPESASENKESELKAPSSIGSPSVTVVAPEPAASSLERTAGEKTGEVPSVTEEKTSEPASVSEEAKPVSDLAPIAVAQPEQVDLPPGVDTRKDIAETPLVVEESSSVDQLPYLDAKPPTPGASLSQVEISVASEADGTKTPPKPTQKPEEADAPKVEKPDTAANVEPSAGQKAEDVPEVPPPAAEGVEVDPPVAAKDKKPNKSKRSKTPIQAAAASIVEKPVTRKSERIDREKLKRSNSPRGEAQKLLELKMEAEKITRTASKNSASDPEHPEPSLPLSRTRRRNVRSVYATMGDHESRSPVKEPVEQTRVTRKRLERELQEAAAVPTTPRRGRPPKTRRRADEDDETEAKEPVETVKPAEGWRSPRSQKVAAGGQQGKRGKNEPKVDIERPEATTEVSPQVNVKESNTKSKADKEEAGSEQKRDRTEMSTDKNPPETPPVEVVEKKTAPEKNSKSKRGRARNSRSAVDRSANLKNVEATVSPSVTAGPAGLPAEEESGVVAVSPEKSESPQKEGSSSLQLNSEPADPDKELEKEDVSASKPPPEANQLAKQMELEQAVENIEKLTETSTPAAFKAAATDAPEGLSTEDGDKPAHQASETELAAAIGSIINDISGEPENFPAPAPYSAESRTDLQPPEGGMEPETDEAVSGILETEAATESSKPPSSAPDPSAGSADTKEARGNSSETSHPAPEAKGSKEAEVTLARKDKGRQKTTRSRRKRNTNKKTGGAAETHGSEPEQAQSKSPATSEGTVIQPPESPQEEKQSDKPQSTPPESCASDPSKTPSQETLSQESSVDEKTPTKAAVLPDLPPPSQPAAMDDEPQARFKVHSIIESDPVTPPSDSSMSTPPVPSVTIAKLPPPVAAGGIPHQSPPTKVTEWITRQEEPRAQSTPSPALPPDTKASDIDTSSSTLRKILMDPKYVSATGITSTSVTTAIAEPVSAAPCLHEAPPPPVESKKPLLEEKQAAPVTNTSDTQASEVPVAADKEKVTPVIAPKITSVISRMPVSIDLENSQKITLAKPAPQTLTGLVSALTGLVNVSLVPVNALAAPVNALKGPVKGPVATLKGLVNTPAGPVNVLKGPVNVLTGPVNVLATPVNAAAGTVNAASGAVTVTASAVTAASGGVTATTAGAVTVAGAVIAPSAKCKQRSSSNDNSRFHPGSMSVIDDRPADTGSGAGLRVNTSEGVVLLSYSGQKTEGPQRISAKISQIPPASAMDIEFQQSVSKSQVKPDSVTSSQPPPKGPQAPSGYANVATHSTLVLTAQTYNASPVISSVKADRPSLEKPEPIHLSVSTPVTQGGTVKVLTQGINTPPVLVHNQLVLTPSIVTTNKKLADPVTLKIETKVLQPANLGSTLTPHHPPALPSKLPAEVNHVTSGPSTPTDRTVSHLAAPKPDAHSPRPSGPAASPFPRVCHPSSTTSTALSTNATVMLAAGIPVPQFISSIHPEQSVIMPPHSITQTVSLSHLSQGEVRMNTPTLPSITYSIRPETLHSPRAPLQPQQIEVRAPQRAGTPQPAAAGVPALASQHPPEEEVHYHLPVARAAAPVQSEVLVMQSEYRLHPYTVPRDVRIMVHPHVTAVSEQPRATDGVVKVPPASKAPQQPAKEAAKPADAKAAPAPAPHGEARILTVTPSNQLQGLPLTPPVVVTHGVQIVHSSGELFQEYRYGDIRTYHGPTQLTHTQFPAAASIGLPSRTKVPAQGPPPEGESLQPTPPAQPSQPLQPVQSAQPAQPTQPSQLSQPGPPPSSKMPPVSQEAKGTQTGVEQPRLPNVPANRPAEPHAQVQRAQVETSQTSYPSPVSVSMKPDLPAPLPAQAAPKQPLFVPTTSGPSTPPGLALPHAEAQPTPKQDSSPHLASQRPVDMVQLLKKYPIVWQGLLALKNDTAAVQLHFVSGNNVLAHRSLPLSEGGPPLRIAQRMRLEASQLEGVARRMTVESDYCLLLALPCGRDQEDVVSQTESLKAAFITYLQAKQAAGIINVPNPGSNQPAYVLQIFPPCEFSESHLSRLAPDLLASISNISPHLMIVIASV